MDLGYLAAACLLASLSPGPASLSTLGTALRSGASRAQWHTLGLAVAEIPVSLLALAVAAGISQWPWLLKGIAWAGVAWFGHTGVTLLLYPRDSMREEDVGIDGRLALFLRGLMVNLTNPKTIPWMLLIIQTARVPVDDLTSRDLTLFLLCTVGAEAVVMAGYAGLAGKLRPRLAHPSFARGIDRGAGILWLVLAGLALRAALG
jgi:homoserine/homoserine lactone efflux protein